MATIKAEFSGEKGFMAKHMNLFGGVKILKDETDGKDWRGQEIRVLLVQGDNTMIDRIGYALEQADLTGKKYGGWVQASVKSQAIARLQTVASDAKIKKLEKEKTQCQKTIDAVKAKIKKLAERKLPDLKATDPQIKSMHQAQRRIKEIDQELKKLKAEASVKEVALTDAKGAVAFVKQLLENCELYQMSVKAKGNLAEPGYPACIEIKGSVLKKNDFGLDLYLVTAGKRGEGGKTTVEFYLHTLPWEVEIEKSFRDFDGDLKKKSDGKALYKKIARAIDSVEKAENQLNEYKLFMQSLNQFMMELARNIER